MITALQSLIQDIAAYTSPDVFNPWRDRDPLDHANDGPAARCERLHKHFDCNARFLMIGEAPGYQGCHFSGVPFTSEHLLLGGDGGSRVPRVSVRDRISTRPTPWREPSATIVWRQLYALGIQDSTVMWNSYAWHPHKPGEPMSNRTPTQFELTDGADILRAVVDRFQDATVIAIGNSAEWTLGKLGIEPAAKVRHPSMGGANKFREQMAALSIPHPNGDSQ